MDLSPVVRLELTVERWKVSLAFLLDHDEPAEDGEDGEAEQDDPPQPDAPVQVPPMGSTCGDVERAPPWDHDDRPRIGFRAGVRPNG